MSAKSSSFTKRSSQLHEKTTLQSLASKDNASNHHAHFLVADITSIANFENTSFASTSRLYGSHLFHLSLKCQLSRFYIAVRTLLFLMLLILMLFRLLLLRQTLLILSPALISCHCSSTLNTQQHTIVLNSRMSMEAAPIPPKTSEDVKCNRPSLSNQR